ncbi:MAG: hypothetical protein ACI4IW_04650 [Oscillospiraceae bacterium]
MSYSVSHTITETFVRKAIEDIQDSPKRSTRNIVDMALNFADGRFQSRFFQIIQALLRDGNSTYYKLIPDIISNTDKEKIIRFGMNIGYNSCTTGAKKIRVIESQEGFNIPWAVSLEVSGDGYLQNENAYRSMIEQGTELGVYTWMIYVHSGVGSVLRLALEHPECAFVIHCAPGEIDGSMLDRAESINNIMFAVRHTDGVRDACGKLRSGRFLYSVFHTYGEDNLEKLTDGSMLSDTDVLHPVFTGFLPEHNCPKDVQNEAYRCIQSIRSQPSCPTIPWDSVRDSMFVDSIISDGPCSAGFDANGYLYTLGNRPLRLEYNIFRQPLKEIFKLAFPKIEASSSGDPE